MRVAYTDRSLAARLRYPACTLRFRVTDRLEELIRECVGAYGKRKKDRKKTRRKIFLTKVCGSPSDLYIIFNQLIFKNI